MDRAEANKLHFEQYEARMVHRILRAIVVAAQNCHEPGHTHDANGLCARCTLKVEDLTSYLFGTMDSLREQERTAERRLRKAEK